MLKWHIRTVERKEKEVERYEEGQVRQHGNTNRSVGHHKEQTYISFC